MDVNKIYNGLKVKIVADYGDEMRIDPAALARRSVGSIGIVRGHVGGYGGDVWWVEHPSGIAAYRITEFEELK